MESHSSPPLIFPKLFGNTNPVEVEIGCGKGKFLVTRAEQNPHINFFGVDRAGKWMRMGASKVERRKLTNIKFMKAIADQTFPDLIPAGEVSVFHIYFPDPWPKRKHQRRRLLQPAFFAVLHEKLKQGGMVEIATDEADYFASIKKGIAETAKLWKQVRENINERIFAPEIKTNYELKYQSFGRTIYYLELQK